MAFRIITLREKSGKLYSNASTRTVFERELTPAKRNKCRSIFEILRPLHFIKLDRTLLDDPKVDVDLGYWGTYQVCNLEHVELCSPAINLRTRFYKATAVSMAKRYGLHGLLRKFLSKDMPHEIRAIAYIIFNELSSFDQTHGTHLSLYVLSLLPSRISKPDSFADLMSIFWALRCPNTEYMFHRTWGGVFRSFSYERGMYRERLEPVGSCKEQFDKRILALMDKKAQGAEPAGERSQDGQA